VPVKRPLFRYSILVLLFAMTASYEARYVRDILRDQTRQTYAVVPQAGSNQIQNVDPGAARAGVHVGDLLLAVNGVPYTGTGMLGQAFALATPDVPIQLTVLSQGTAEAGERTVSLPVTETPVKFWVVASNLMLYFFLPAVSLLLGFWVAAVRPRDPLAWLLLLLMMTFPHIIESYKVWGWGPGWREAGMVYHAMLQCSFPL